MRFVAELRKDKYDSTKRHFCITKANGLAEELKKSSIVLNFDGDKFTYTNTWESIEYSELAEASPEKADLFKYIKAKSLAESGMIQDDIAKEIGYKSKGSVSKLMEKAKTGNWDAYTSKVKKDDTSNELLF